MAFTHAIRFSFECRTFRSLSSCFIILIQLLLLFFFLQHSLFTMQYVRIVHNLIVFWKQLMRQWWAARFLYEQFNSWCISKIDVQFESARKPLKLNTNRCTQNSPLPYLNNKNNNTSITRSLNQWMHFHEQNPIRFVKHWKYCRSVNMAEFVINRNRTQSRLVVRKKERGSLCANEKLEQMQCVSIAAIIWCVSLGCVCCLLIFAMKGIFQMNSNRRYDVKWN